MKQFKLLYMKLLIKYRILIALPFLFLLLVLNSKAQEQKLHQELSKALSVDGSLYLLNMWGEQPVSKKEVLTLAYEILAKDKNCTYADLARNTEFQELCRKHNIVHLGGPMLGNVTRDGAKVWVRTVKPSKVEVRVKSDLQELVFGPVNSTLESDLTAVVPVSGLKSGTSYPYSVYIDGVEAVNSNKFVLTTLPESENIPDFRIAVGTCFHRWGLGNHDQAKQIVSEKPMAMLLGGDIAAQDRENHTGLHRVDYLLRDMMPAWQHLSGTVPVYATWDDHDYFNNDKSGIPEGFNDADRQAVCKVFRQAWNNPSYGIEEVNKGLFFRTRIGPADVIMLDGRFFRAGVKGSFLGDEQTKWLEKQLLDCKGPFIILSCGTMWSDYVSKGKDSWGVNDPEGRERLFSFIEKNRIGGVILISGDRHGARGFRIPRPSGFSFYEFESASLGGRSGPEVTNPAWDTQLYGFSGIYAFGEFSFNTTMSDPEVTFRLIKDDGTVLHKIRLTRSQLTPPGQKK